MTARDIKIAREFKKRLAAQAQLLDFKVFGSRARGDSETASDMDVFVEVETLTPLQKEGIYKTAWNMGLGSGMQDCKLNPTIEGRKKGSELKTWKIAVPENQTSLLPANERAGARESPAF